MKPDCANARAGIMSAPASQPLWVCFHRAVVLVFPSLSSLWFDERELSAVDVLELSEIEGRVAGMAVSPTSHRVAVAGDV